MKPHTAVWAGLMIVLCSSGAAARPDAETVERDRRFLRQMQTPPPVAAETRPEVPPEVRAGVDTLLHGYVEAGAKGDLPAQAACLADRVNYFGREMAARKALHQPDGEAPLEWVGLQRVEPAGEGRLRARFSVRTAGKAARRGPIELREAILARDAGGHLKITAMRKLPLPSPGEAPPQP